MSQARSIFSDALLLLAHFVQAELDSLYYTLKYLFYYSNSQYIGIYYFV